MAAYKIIVCSNDETICDGYTDDRSDAWAKEIGTVFVQAAAKVIDDARFSGRDVELACDSSFREWHGGRHYKCGGRVGAVPAWGYSAGLVVCHAQDPPHWVAELCEAAAQAGADARDAYVATLEEEYERTAAEESALED